jgi:putative spermidine/putrescine transport system ATP-binding protein
MRTGSQLLAVRPEKLRVLGNGEAGELNVLEARVREIVYQGESSLAYLTLSGGGDLALRWTGTAPVPGPGEAIRLGLAPEDTILVPAEDR